MIVQVYKRPWLDDGCGTCDSIGFYEAPSLEKAKEIFSAPRYEVRILPINPLPPESQWENW